jgi:hypothetical protein
MTAPVWVYELAEVFWRWAGFVEAFPRTLRDAVRWLPFDLTVKEKPCLSIYTVENYLDHLGTRWRCGEPDRPLHACLVAYDGAAWIFLDRDDPPDEQTASLAHELAHFLRHYWQPRQQAVKELGPGILDVLDDRRPATPAERLNAVLRGAPVGVHHHLMRRGEAAVSPAIERAEREADRLAWELLAPADEVLRRLGKRDGFDEAVVLLNESFGLPWEVAESYADALFPEEEDSPVVLDLKKLLDVRRDPTR